MNDREHARYVYFSLIWNGVIRSVKQKPYTYRCIRAVRSPKERAEVKTSRHATRILAMPPPQRAEHIFDSNSKPIQVYSDIYPSIVEKSARFGSVPVAENFAVRDITYDEKYDNPVYANEKLAELYKKDHSIAGGEKEIASLVKQKQLKASGDGIATWMDIPELGQKESNDERLTALMKDVEQKKDKLVEAHLPGYNRPIRGSFARFADQWHLNYHIDKACDFYHQQTGIDEFYVIIQRWPGRSDERHIIYACYFIVDSIEEDLDSLGL